MADLQQRKTVRQTTPARSASTPAVAGVGAGIGRKSTVRTPGKSTARVKSPSTRGGTTRRSTVSSGGVQARSFRRGIGSGWYIVGGIFLGCLLLYFMHGDTLKTVFADKAKKPPAVVSGGSGGHGGHDDYSGMPVPTVAPKEINRWRDTVKRKVAPAAQPQKQALSPKDEKAVELLAEAHALFDAGAERQGGERNRYYIRVVEICNAIGDDDEISEPLQKEARFLKIAAMKHRTMR